MTRLERSRAARRQPRERVTAALPKPAGVDLYFLTGRGRKAAS